MKNGEIKEKEVKKGESTTMLISLLKPEEDLIYKLTTVLYNRGYIKHPRKSEAVRYCCKAVAYLIAKEIEEERLGGKEEK